MKVVSIVGARPQFIKASPLSRALLDSHEEVMVHTGQHYDKGLSDVFFTELGIAEPEYYLDVGSGPHGSQVAEMMAGIGPVIDEEAPDAVLVYGDTNSTLAGALVGAKKAPLLAHVEAGLRSYNREMPEEINRVLTDHAADVLFAPTERAAETLRTEGVAGDVHTTGDVMYDAITQVQKRTSRGSSIRSELGLRANDYLLATVHRPQNTDDRNRLRSIVRALASVPTPVVLPAHPRTVEALERYGLKERAETEIDIIPPVGYLDFVQLLDGAERVATDSGGIQKEAFYLGTPCVTLREETEWVETVECGWNTLVGADERAIRRALTAEFESPPKPLLYGDGHAATKIVTALERAIESTAPLPTQ